MHLGDMELDTRNISKWLEVTPQQFEILEAIYRLQLEGKTASPKSIVEEDSKMHDGPKIQKSNLFTQLKALRNKNLIEQNEKASYVIKFAGIKEKLKKTESVIEEEVAEFKKACQETEHYFKEFSEDEEAPLIKFLPYDTAHDKVADIIKGSERCFITGVFPRLLYANSPAFLNLPYSKRYGEMLWERCIREKALEITYLARFDIEYVFKRMNNAYDDPKLTYEELKVVLTTLEHLVKSNDNIHFYFIDAPYLLDLIIPHNKTENEVFIMIRDEQMHGVGSVYVRSSDLAVRFKRIYLEELKRATRLDEDSIESVVKKLRERLDRAYEKAMKHRPKAAEE